MFDNLTLDEARHHATLFAALFMSDHWNNSWLDYRTSPSDGMRRFALKCKAKAIINFDRTLCNDKRLLTEE